MYESVVNDISSILGMFQHVVISLKGVCAAQASHTAPDIAVESNENRV